MDRIAKYSVGAFIVTVAWIVGGIMAMPFEIVRLDSDLSVQPLHSVKIVYSGDIQPAGDAGLLWTTTDPQKQ